MRAESGGDPLHDQERRCSATAIARTRHRLHYQPQEKNKPELRPSRYSERSCCCARFPNRMVDYVADNAAVLEEAHEP